MASKRNASKYRASRSKVSEASKASKSGTPRELVHGAEPVLPQHAGASSRVPTSGRTIELSIPRFDEPPEENFVELIKSMNDEEFTQYAKEHKFDNPLLKHRLPIARDILRMIDLIGDPSECANEEFDTIHSKYRTKESDAWRQQKMDELEVTGEVDLGLGLGLKIK